MKKFLSILALAAIMTACNNGDDANDAADSTKDAIDSSADATKDAVDSAANAGKNAVDSAQDRKDSINKK